MPKPHQKGKLRNKQRAARNAESEKTWRWSAGDQYAKTIERFRTDDGQTRPTSEGDMTAFQERALAGQYEATQCYRRELEDLSAESYEPKLSELRATHASPLLAIIACIEGFSYPPAELLLALRDNLNAYLDGEEDLQTALLDSTRSKSGDFRARRRRQLDDRYLASEINGEMITNRSTREEAANRVVLRLELKDRLGNPLNEDSLVSRLNESGLLMTMHEAADRASSNSGG